MGCSLSKLPTTETAMASANTKDIKDMKSASARGCPFHTQKAAAAAMDWWPNQLNLKSLGKVPPAEPKPYIEEMKSLDIKELKDDIVAVMTTSVDWWPADYGHYGPFFIRMAWHSAGTYRTLDGRGGGGHGMLRFAPLNSWPDNGNLDKARRLLWPLKRKYGRKVSWADLMLYTGHCALEHMGLKTFGFAFGREDLWEPEDDIYWGQETEWLAAERGGAGAELDKPLGAVQMGLIYVNPEGPGGNPDPLQSAHDIRETFGRMAMNDEETVALIAGGHTFGKGHGAADPSKHVGPEPEGASIEEQGLGWKNSFGTGKGADTITSGLEGAWTANPAKWDHGYFENLMKYEWTQSKSPAGATLWIPTDKDAATLVPDAHVPDKKHPPVMFTTDLALKMDPQYAGISKRFHENPEEFADAFAKAWYKLTHRDMGPHARLVGPLVPPAQIWQDPIPPPSGAPLGASEIAELKSELLKEANGLSISELVKTAWAAAASYRGTDHRGGANGARVRLEPQKQWAANDPPALATALEKLEKVRSAFNAKGGAQASLADVIVLGGCAAIESAAKSGGNEVVVPFSPGRTDATQEQTDAASFAVLEPTADGFRNYLGAADKRSPQSMGASPEALLVDKAHMLNLTKAEMTVLVAGLRVLGANTGGATEGVLTATPGVLTNDFFVNLLDMSVVWSKKDGGDEVYEGKSRSDGTAKWTASRVDLIFGSNSQLRALAEHYACDDAKATFVADFVAAWSKVMDLDRYDLKK